MMKKIIALFLAMSTLLGIFTVSVSAAAPRYTANNVPVYLFDPDYYASRYVDLYVAFGNNKEALYDHFLRWGKAEGRSPSPVFDPDFYVDNNPDLMAAFGRNYEKLYDHFSEYGVHEFRKSSPVYNGRVYYDNCADIRWMLGGDSRNYLRHFCNSGMTQCRTGSEHFTLQVYHDNYADLRNAYGSSWKSYYIHYLVYGQDENRIASTTPYIPSVNNKTDREQEIVSKLNAMMDGSSHNGTYCKNTKYEGPYAGEQCKGFAKSVFNELFGCNIGRSYTKESGLNYLIQNNSNETKCLGRVTVMTEDAVKNLYSQARAGDFVQMRRSHGGAHSAILLSVSEAGVTFFEANLDNDNGIVTRTYTWRQLCKNAAMSVYTAINY